MIKKFYINQDGKAKVLLISKEDKKTIIGILEVNLKNDIREGLYKYYYNLVHYRKREILKTIKQKVYLKNITNLGKLRKEANYKNSVEEGLWKYYDESEN